MQNYAKEAPSEIWNMRLAVGTKAEILIIIWTHQFQAKETGYSVGYVGI